jgi:hypothetical protein
MKGQPRIAARAKPQSQATRRQRIVVKAVPITVSGASGIGFGTAVIGDLPEGNILFFGATGYMQFTKDATATLVTATFTGNYSVGTAPTADATLNGAEVDLLPSVAISAATAGVSPVVRAANATPVMLDNTDGALEVNLQMLIADAEISGASQLLSATGVIDLVYVVLGDD